MRQVKRALVPAKDKAKLIGLLTGEDGSAGQLEAGSIIADDLSRAHRAGAGEDEIKERAVVLARAASELNRRVEGAARTRLRALAA
jgi:hypothetical protein